MLGELPKRNRMKVEPIKFLHMAATNSGLLQFAHSDGSATHPYVARLKGHGADPRDLADAVHFLCILHGAHPSIVDEAANRAVERGERDMLRTAAQAFTTERAYLLHIAPAAGPAPSTPGHRASETAASEQVRAIHTLAHSERMGVAYGAALALMIDWIDIRTVLETLADRLDIDPQPEALPEPEKISEQFDQLATSVPIQRAMRFGAQQLFAQHRGLWSLLEARSSARSRR